MGEEEEEEVRFTEHKSSKSIVVVSVANVRTDDLFFLLKISIIHSMIIKSLSI